MPVLFTAPFETLAADDVQALIGWPESLTAEFKREISGSRGRPDNWTTGGRVEDPGRDKLFKEIVALANTAGGHLVIGVDEADSSPPTAAGITPVPRCADLAERLIQMAQSIDPPIPQLAAVGICTDGDSGVVIVRVPASRMAPHRSTDREVYVRRGTNSIPVSMREVRDLVLLSERSGKAVDAMFAKASIEFREWMREQLPSRVPGAPPSPQAGFRITAVPIGGTFALERLPGRLNCGKLIPEFKLTGGSTAYALRLPTTERPIIRGVRMYHHGEGNPSYIDVTTSGLVSAGFKMIGPAPHEKALMMLAWVLGYMLNVLRLTDFCRDDAGIPECEYAIETEFAVQGGDCLKLGNTGVGWHDDLGIIPADSLPLTLPRISYGPRQEAGIVISQVANDFSDAVGDNREQPWNLQLAPG